MPYTEPQIFETINRLARVYLESYPDDHDTRTSDGRPLYDHIRESKLWGEIHRAAQTNPTLQDALERAIMIYKLTKTK